jgi:hypothetical protein
MPNINGTSHAIYSYGKPELPLMADEDSVFLSDKEKHHD